MISRRAFGLAGLSTVAAAVGDRSLFAQGAGGGHAEHDDASVACARACSDCQRECDACAAHCAHLLADGRKEHAATLATCQDCADFCAAAAQIVARGGPFAALICASCEEACARCGKACEKFPDDKHMKKCAEECRKCEKACREMVKHAGHVKPV